MAPHHELAHHLEAGAEALRLLQEERSPAILDMLEDLCYYHYRAAIGAARRGGRI